MLRRGRQVIGGGVLAVLVSVSVILIDATPAYACSCGADAFAFFDETEAELAFVGTVSDKQSLFGRSDTIWTFEVEEVLVGEAGPTVVIRAPSLAASCALSVEENANLAVIGFKEEGVWTTISCDTGSPAQAAQFGDPRPPDPSIGPGRTYTNKEVGFAGAGIAIVGTIVGTRVSSRRRQTRETAV